MQTLKEIAALQQSGRPTYYDDPEKDRMLAIILELAEEICVLRSELETALLLGGQGQAVNQAALDTFEPDSALLEQRLLQYTRFFEDLLGRLENDGTMADA